MTKLSATDKLAIEVVRSIAEGEQYVTTYCESMRSVRTRHLQLSDPAKQSHT